MKSILEEMVRLVDEGREFAVATVAETKGSVPGKVGAKMIVLADGSTIGTVGGAGLEERVKKLGAGCLASRKGGIFSFDLMHYKAGGLDSLCGGSVTIVIEHVARRTHLLICGGGHVGLAVAKACAPLDFAYSVLDDRAEYAARGRFPGAKELFVSAPGDFFSKADLSGYTHLLILGYSHQVDTEILLEAVRRFPGWIGLISSKTKRREMFNRLKARGVAEADLARVEAPLGVPIGAETPAEIAVSILASIIKSVRLSSGQNSEEPHAEKAESAGS